MEQMKLTKRGGRMTSDHLELDVHGIRTVLIASVETTPKARQMAEKLVERYNRVEDPFRNASEALRDLSDEDFMELVHAEVQERVTSMSCSESRRYGDEIRGTLTKMLT